MLERYQRKAGVNKGVISASDKQMGESAGISNNISGKLAAGNNWAGGW